MTVESAPHNQLNCSCCGESIVNYPMLFLSYTS